MAFRSDIERWLRMGLELKTTHMIVIRDVDAGRDYPVYAKTVENARAKVAKVSNDAREAVVGVYSLRCKDVFGQLNVEHCFNYD